MNRVVLTPDLPSAAGITTGKSTAMGQNSVVTQHSTNDMNRLISIMKSAASLPELNKPRVATKPNALSRRENSLESNITSKRRNSFAL